MLNGNVMTALLGTDLFLMGDSESNSISIESTEAGITLTGQDNTTLNGQANSLVLSPSDNPATGNVYVFLRGGNDQFVVREDVNFGQSLFVYGGKGDDLVGLQQTNIQNSLVFFGGTGDDSLVIESSQIDSSLFHFSGSGNDLIELTNTSVGKDFVSVSGSGHDSVLQREVRIERDQRINTGAGADEVSIEESTTGRHFRLHSGAGADVVQLEGSSVARSSIVRFGSGNDSAELNRNTAPSGIDLVTGGSGVHQVSITPAQNSPSPFVVAVESDSPESVDDYLNENGYAKADQIRQTLNISRDLPQISAEVAGNNAVESNGVTITKKSDFLVSGQATGTHVEIDRDLDGQFNDGIVEIAQDGSFELTVELNRDGAIEGLNQFRIRSTDGFRTSAAETFRVHYAVGSVVRFESQAGSFDIELSSDPDLAETVANFLAYDERYDGSILHRSSTRANGEDFVIQGGGYRKDGTSIIPISTAPPVINQSLGAPSNLRGTIAMALPGGNIDGGTSQWFINLSDTNTFLDADDFTVFGKVVGAGMQVVDSLHDIPTFNLAAATADPAFTELPLNDYSEPPLTLTGDVSLSTGSNQLVGNNTAFLTELVAGSEIQVGGQSYVITSVISDSQAILETIPTITLSNSTYTTGGVPASDDYIVFDQIDELSFLDSEPE